VPTKLGDFKTQFEFDLFATGNDVGEHNFRLRHAWGSLGQVLAGQTNSLFMDGDVFHTASTGAQRMVFRNVQFDDADRRKASCPESSGPGASADAGLDRIEPTGIVHFPYPTHRPLPLRRCGDIQLPIFRYGLTDTL
jgi:hypothetical protein